VIFMSGRIISPLFGEPPEYEFFGNEEIWEKLRQNAKRCKENAGRKFREAHPVNVAVEKAQSIARRKIIEKSIALRGKIQEACAHGNIRVRAHRSPARSKFNTANTGGSGDDDGGSDSSDSDLPGPGSRAYHLHPLTSHSKRNKLKYLTWRVSCYC
jgi:hypothetical protein